MREYNLLLSLRVKKNTTALSKVLITTRPRRIHSKINRYSPSPHSLSQINRSAQARAKSHRITRLRIPLLLQAQSKPSQLAMQPIQWHWIKHRFSKLPRMSLLWLWHWAIKKTCKINQIETNLKAGLIKSWVLRMSITPDRAITASQTHRRMETLTDSLQLLGLMSKSKIITARSRLLGMTLVIIRMI